MRIRKAAERDLPAVVELYRTFGDAKVLSPAAAARIFRRMRRYPDFTLYVSVDEGRIVGTFALLIMDNLAHMGARSAVVEDVAVEPSLQGRGIGRAMMEFARRRARAAGCYKLALSSALKRKAAHRFYEALGFSRHGYSFLVQP
jgi:GNAT superfamily N-acetyltransferase